MDQLDWLQIPLWILGALLFLFAARYAVLLELLLRLRFEAGRSILIPREKLPSSVREILDLAGPRLQALGFERRLTQAIWNGLVSTRDKPLFADVYFHPATRCHASVLPAEEPEPGALYSVEFLSCFADGRLLATLNRRLHTIPLLPPEWLAEDRYLASVEEQWALHQERLAASGETQTIDDPAEVWRRTQKLHSGYLRHLDEARMVRPTREPGEWRFTLRGAWRFLRQLVAGARRAAATRPQAAGESTRAKALADAFAFARSMAAVDNAPANWLGKLLLFGFSAVLGAIAFGVAWSWQIVPLLLAVLLFHEMGHLAAMRLSGYRDLNVFFIPFLGAAATGRKDDATPWQRLFVYLAGPVPGLILGAVCIHYAFETAGEVQSWLIQFGALALALNFFNLLPFLPLDGGRVVETLLFTRFPRLRVAFVAVSSALLMAGGFYTGDWLLILIGALLAFALPADLRVARLAQAVRLSGVNVAERKRALRSLFGVLARSGRAAKLNFPQRVQTAKAALPLVMQRVPRPLETLMGMALYVFIIAAPVAAFVAMDPEGRIGGPEVILDAAMRDRAASPPTPDWEARVAAAPDAAARWQVLLDAGLWHEEAEEYAAARGYYKRAFEVTEGFAAGDLRAVDALIARARVTEHPARAVEFYNEAMAALSDAQGRDRLRVADVLEALYLLQTDASPEARIARLQHALAIRESLPDAADYRLYATRRQLALLLDGTGDIAGSEALLRQSLTPLPGAPAPDGRWSWLPYHDLAWFLMLHGRTAEAEALLQSAPEAPGDASAAPGAQTSLRTALAWARLLQGRHQEAAAILESLLPRSGAAQQAASGSMPQLDLLLDLAIVGRRRGDAGAEQKWLAEARALMKELPEYVAQTVKSQRYPALVESAQGWESLRWQAQAEVAAML